MRLAVGRIASIIMVAAGWVLFGVRTVLELIGYSTAPEDVEVAKTRLEQGLDLLLAAPWWAVLGFALASTLLLIWVSWPRSSPPSTHPAVADSTIAAKTKVRGQICLF